MLTNAPMIEESDILNSINKNGMLIGNQGQIINRGVLLQNYTQEAINACWNSLCTLIVQNYTSGKGTIIKGFGTFTFNNYECNLEGTTNQYQRDNKNRSPVFIVSPEFSSTLKPGQYTKSGLIYYNQKAVNGISHSRINYSELAFGNSMSKDECTHIIDNTIKHLSEEISNGRFENKNMPGLGQLLINRNVFGVKFNEDLINLTRPKPQKLNIFKKNIRIGMDLSSAQNCFAGTIENPYNKAEELRPATSLITKLTQTGNNFFKRSLNFNINTVPVHEYQPCVQKILSQSHENGIKVINDCIQQPKVYIDGKKLKDLYLSKDILESFEFFKGVLISNMKQNDTKSNGIIKTSDCIKILSSSNIHDFMDMSLAKSIVDLYSKQYEEIDYMQFIGSLIKDARIILTGLSSKIMQNENKPNSRRGSRCQSQSSFFPQITTPRPHTRLSVSNSTRNLNRSMLQQSHTSFNIIQNQKKDIDMIKHQFSSIKTVIPKIKISNNTRLDQNISVSEFGNILAEYSIVYPKETLIKILEFLQIDNINSFTLNEFEMKTNKITVLETKIDDDDLNKAFARAKDAFFFKGTKSQIFKYGGEISKNEFIDIIVNNSIVTQETAESLYNYIVKTSRNFTIEDYEKFFESNKTVYNEEFELKAMRTIHVITEKKHLMPDEYFDFLLTYNESTKNKLLSRLDFIKACLKEKYPFTAEELDYIFNYFDIKKDNMIDREEFLSRINHVTLPLSELQHIIKKNHLDIEDIMHKIGITRGDEQKFTLEAFKYKMKQLDYTFSNDFIVGLFKSLKQKNTEVVTSENLIKELEKKGANEKSISFTASFKEAVKKAVDFKTLKRSYENADKYSVGIIPKVSFCSVLQEYLPDYTEEDIIKFVRITNMFDKNNIMVRYPDLLNLIYYNESSDQFNHLCEILKNIINNKYNGKIEKLLMKMSYQHKVQPVSAEVFKSFLKNEEGINEDIPLKIFCKLDVDADGLISFEDLKCTIGRYVNSSYFKYENKESSSDINLYASDTMGEDKFKSLVKNIKSYMKFKNITELGLFHKLDANNDGFISSLDFNTKIDSILPMAPAIKDQFFNYLDYYNNGLVDQETFVNRLNNVAIASLLPKNANHIENVIIDEFSKFIKKNMGLSETEIFSLMDKDSDGIINMNDFKRFIIESLIISKYEFNDCKIERVMQALSLSKNKLIGLNDIREFMNKAKSDTIKKYQLNLKEIFKATSNQNLHPNKDNTDWVNEVIERFGMFISEKYDNVKDFFEQNSEKGQNKFLFSDFLKFNENNYECFDNGFNLTKDELLSVFTSLDSQKKNYLLLEDLETKLQIFDFYRKMHIDIKNFIKQNFYDSIDAFKIFFDPKGEIDIKDIDNIRITTISKKNLFDTFVYFFPNKYATETLLKYLEKYFKSPSVSFSEFNYLYFDTIIPNEKFIEKRGKETKLLTCRKELLRSHSDFKFNKSKLATAFDDDPLNKIRRILNSTRFDLKAFFNVAELQSTNGIINKFQFRNIIKKLNLGLTNIEIDSIIARNLKMTYDCQLSLKDFISYLKGEDPVVTHGKHNVALIIGNIKQLIYKYYSNPLICFHLTDRGQTKRIDFDKFKRIVTELYNREQREGPNFTMLKNAYDFLDLRKDGIIDESEWMRAFGSFNGTNDYKANQVDNGFEFYSKKKSDTFFNANRKVLREWESSGDICQIYKLITKNKKSIKKALGDFILEKPGTQIVQSDNLVAVLKDMFPLAKISHTQWKMLVMIGKTEIENLVDLQIFFTMVEQSARNMINQAKKFL